jgi:Transglycosylase SLT domain
MDRSYDRPYSVPVALTKVDEMLIRRVQTSRLVGTCLFCVLSAAAASAQLSAPDDAGDLKRQPIASSSAPQVGEEGPSGDSTERTTGNSLSICQVLQSEAAANGLPFEFFARVIWQESRFRSDAVGPLTRSGQRAQGIAQFMPVTAAERLLHNPFDPAEALPKSAAFLRELRDEFGNLGLAAAAYNAGPQRVRDWLAGKRTLPSETQAYVRIVTGRPAQEWARPEQKVLMVAIPREMSCAATVKTVAKLQPPPAPAQPKPTSPWVVQLIGDRSEIRALTMYRQLQKKHEALLGSYEPVIIRTTLGAVPTPIWIRVHIDADSRQVAETLCTRLRAAREECLVQRN